MQNKIRVWQPVKKIKVKNIFLSLNLEKTTI